MGASAARQNLVEMDCFTRGLRLGLAMTDAGAMQSCAHERRQSSLGQYGLAARVIARSAERDAAILAIAVHQTD